jgi:O-antigen/teichoic acid export membrane protein
MKEQIFQLGKNSMIYGVGNMLTRFISLLLLPLFTAYLTPADYGVLALLALLSFVAQPVFSLGLSAAMGPSYFEGNDVRRKSETIWTAFLILVGSVTILISIAWLFPRQLSMLALQSPEYGHLVSLTLTGCAISILSKPFTQRIQFEERAKAFVIITLITSIISITLSVTTVVFLGWGVKGMVVSQLLGQTIHLLTFLAAGAKDTKFLYGKPIARELIGLGIPLVPSFAFLFILMQSNRYILQWFAGLEQVGIYSIGFSIGMVMSVATGAVSTAWYPFFMSYMEKQKDAEILFGKIFTYYIYGEISCVSHDSTCLS